MENAIALLAEGLVAQNKVLKAKSNSVFEFIDLVQGDSDKIQEVSKEISIKLANEISLMKNKLLPLMREVDVLIQDKAKNYTKEAESSKYNIVEFDMPIVVPNLKEAGLIPKKHDEPDRIQEERLHVPAPSKLELTKYLELNNASTTNALHVDVGAFDDDQLLAIWEDYLGNISSTNLKLSVLLSNPVANIVTIVILFAMAYNLVKSKPVEVDASDDKYYGIMKSFRDILANYISFADHIFSAGRAKDKLIVGYSPDGYTIKVDVKLYKKFIEDKNSPEILLGLAVSEYKQDVEYLFLDKIIANKDLLTEHWNKKLKIEHYTQSVQEVSMYKAIYSFILPEVYELIPEDLRELLSVNVDEAKVKLQEKVDTEPASEIVNSIYMAREIVGGVIFPQTSFHKFTHYMMEIEKMNPDFGEKEIANFATVELLLHYLTDQLVLESV